MSERFPFTQVVGMDDAKLAMLLVAVDPMIGGVLLRGQKGSAKTTLARGLADLLGEQAPFVDLPLGATEDRLIGTLDLTAALTDGDIRFTPGLLAAAHRGVLYIDEVNLLADHLVDTLLDVSVSGVNRVEREGFSHSHPARFVMIGSMNPEEGELRPQLLDRFGLCVEVTAPVEIDQRVEAVRRRLRFDSPDGRVEADGEADLRARLETARPGEIDDHLIEAASRLAVAVGAEGLRADLVLCRAAAAHAGLHGRHLTTQDDLRRIAHLVLAHRRRRMPFDPPTLAPEELQQRLDEVLGEPDGGEDRPERDHTPAGGPSPERPLAIGAERVTPAPERARPTPSARGRYVGTVPFEPGSGRPIAVAASVRSLVSRQTAGDPSPVRAADLRESVRVETPGRLLIVCVDLSGSMGADARARLATGAVLGLLTDAYQRRDQVALVTFRGEGAQVSLSPTSSIEVARNRLGALTTGGTTPLAAGLETALSLATRRLPQGHTPMLIVLSDGRATGRPDAWEQAMAAARAIATSGTRTVIFDCETGPTRLGLAAELAQAAGAECVQAADLSPSSFAGLIRERIGSW